MKKLALIMLLFFVLSTVASVSAGDFILYGGAQKTGKIDYSTPVAVPDNLLSGDFGGTLGIRFSGGRIIGLEQNISYSPKFAKPGLRAFQMDTNLIVQAPGKIAPYVTGGIGFIRTWGVDAPADLTDLSKVAAFVFNFGTKFSLNYGGGIKLRKLAGPLGFNIDVRGYTLPGFNESNLNFIQTSAGVVFSW
jgi:hypothetical protein